MSYGKTDWTMTQMHFATSKGFWINVPGAEPRRLNVPQLYGLIRMGKVDKPPISDEELMSRAERNLFVKSLGVLSIIWFVIQFVARGFHKQCLCTPLELMTAAFMLNSVSTYLITFGKPQNINFPVCLAILGTPRSASDQESTKYPEVENTGFTEEDIDDMLEKADEMADKEQQPAELWTNFRTFMAFISGLVLCTAWDFPFPSTTERRAWQICAVAIMFLPLLRRHETSDLWLRAPKTFIFKTLILVCPCFVAKLAIIILALLSLRALPDAAYETVGGSIRPSKV